MQKKIRQLQLCEQRSFNRLLRKNGFMAPNTYYSCSVKAFSTRRSIVTLEDIYLWMKNVRLQSKQFFVDFLVKQHSHKQLAHVP